MPLTRLYQLVSARETASGQYVTDGTLLQAGNAGLFITDPSLTYTPETFVREVASGSLSSPTPSIGATRGEYTFSVAVAGRVGASEPRWGELLEACGFRKTTIRKGSGTLAGGHTEQDLYHGRILSNDVGDVPSIRILFDNYDGGNFWYEFLPGIAALPAALDTSDGDAILTAVTDGAGGDYGTAWVPTSFELVRFGVDDTTGMAAGDVYQGNTNGTVFAVVAVESVNDIIDVRIVGGSGTIDPDEAATLLNGGGPATINVDDGTGGEPDVPAQQDIPSLSMALIEDGRVKTLSGSRGSVSWSGELGQQMNLNFTFQGVIENLPSDEALAATFDENQPPVLLGEPVTVRSTQDNTILFEPCLTSFTVDMGHGISFRRCMDRNSGLVDGHITSRNPTLTMDPEAGAEDTFPFLRDMKDGFPFVFDLEWGETDDSGDIVPGNHFRLQAPACQVTGESSGDRDGIGVSEYTAQLSSRRPDGGEGREREIIFAIFDVDPTT